MAQLLRLQTVIPEAVPTRRQHRPAAVVDTPEVAATPAEIAVEET